MFHNRSPLTKQLGSMGESITADYLTKQGFTIVARNYFIRGGEIDIIASKGDILAFVEVKTRKQHTFALSQVVTTSKQTKIIFAAKYFLAKHPAPHKILRFDISLVENNEITYIPNAFAETNRY